AEKITNLYGNKVVIGLIDTGVDYSHPYIAGNLLNGVNVITPAMPPQDDHGHGTQLAGVITSIIKKTDSEVMIFPIKALNNVASSESEVIAKGIRIAVDNNVDIISLSLGLHYNDLLIYDAIKYAYDHDITVIASAGNDGGEVLYPALYPEVL